MATATYLPMRVKSASHRSPAQKAATKRMIAGLKASRRSNTVTLKGLDRLPMGTWAKSGHKTAKGGKFVHTGTTTHAYKGKVVTSKSGKKRFVRASKAPTHRTAKRPTKRPTKKGSAVSFVTSTGEVVRFKARDKGGKKKSSQKSSPRRSNGSGRFVASPKTKTIHRTREVLVHRTKHMRNPVGFDHVDGLTRLGTWGKVGLGVLFGLAGLLVAFGIPKGLAVITGKDFFQRGWGGVATAAVASIGVGFLVSLLSKRASLGLLTAAGVGVALLAMGAILGKNAQVLIPVNEAVLASMLPMWNSTAAPAPAGSQTVKAPLYNQPGVGLVTMDPILAQTMGLQPVGMGTITYYPAAPSGAGTYPDTYYPAAPSGAGTYPEMPLNRVTHYPAGSAGYNAPAPGAVGTPNAQVYERAAGQTSGPQGYNAPAPGAVATSDPNVRYSATTKEKF
jgi:hypothetical protein